MFESLMDESVSILLVASLLALFAVSIVSDIRIWRKGLYIVLLGLSLWGYFSTGSEALSLVGAAIAIVIGVLSGWILTQKRAKRQKE